MNEKKRAVTSVIAEYLNQNVSAEIEIDKCSCGALTMSNDSNNEQISFLASNAPFIKETNDFEGHNCNHCLNGWGVDAEENEEENEEEDEED